MEAKAYKLSCYLLGHSEDVRALAVFDDGTFVSTSRDKTSIVWTPNSGTTGYTQKSVLKGHTNFVSSVHVINPCAEYPKGMIITGGQDNVMCIYECYDTEPKYKINTHKDNICCLRPGHDRLTFLSSSWDHTAQLWSLQNTNEPLVTLIGHTSAVWSVVAASNKRIITASADKLIIVWQNNGSCLQKLRGHTDCVRDLAIINDEEFLSCANDFHIKRWNINTGQCIKTYSSHTNFIYSVDFNPTTLMCITSGEDSCVKVWENDAVIQNIVLPVQSVWCTKWLKNSDIITGANDGIIRIFTCNPEKYASEEELKAFEDAVGAKMFGVDEKSLSDISILSRPGQNDGQIAMVKDGGKAVAYSWSASKNKWEKIGEILGQQESTPKKQLYNGVDYDFVFSVDIEDGAPPLKLPYNIGQDPWEVAQKFIQDNGIDTRFLEQVANFIITNSKQSSTSNVSNNSQFADPFTGGNRYVPGSSDSTSITSPTSVAQTALPVTSYIPQQTFIKLEQANTSAIFAKLKELNDSMDEAMKITYKDFHVLKKVVTTSSDESQKAEAVIIMNKLLQWPRENIFPVLDIARLLALKHKVNEQLCTEEKIAMIKSNIKSDAIPANQMLTFRLLANMFSFTKGESINMQIKDEILNLLPLQSLGNKHNQIAVSTYLLNLVVALNRRNDNNGRVQVLDAMLKVLSRLNDQESTFRILVAIGTLLATPSTDKAKLIETVQQSETALSILTTISDNVSDQTMNKLIDCSEFIIKLIFQNK